jgi:hypothetical protein
MLTNVILHILNTAEYDFLSNEGRDSSVDILNHYELYGPEIESLWGAKYSVPVETDPGAQPVYYTMGTRSFPGVNRPGRGLYHHPDLGPR